MIQKAQVLILEDILAQTASGSLLKFGDLMAYMPADYEPQVGSLYSVMKEGEHTDENGNLIYSRRVGSRNSKPEYVAMPYVEAVVEEVPTAPSKPEPYFELSTEAEVGSYLVGHQIMVIKWGYDETVFVGKLEKGEVAITRGLAPREMSKFMVDLSRIGEVFFSRGEIISAVCAVDGNGDYYFVEILTGGRPINGALLGQIWSELGIPIRVLAYAKSYALGWTWDNGAYVKPMVEMRSGENKRMAFRFEETEDADADELS